MEVGRRGRGKERPSVPFRAQAVDGIHGLLAGRPAVHPDTVHGRREQRDPVLHGERRRVLAQHLRRETEIRQLLLDPVRAPGPHDVQFVPVAVEQRDADLPVDPAFRKLDDPEDGEVRLDQLVEVQRRRHVDRVVHPPGDDARHVGGHGHPFAVHDHARLDPVGRRLEIAARLAPRVKHDAVCVERAEHALHAREVILFPGALVPRIVCNEELRPARARERHLALSSAIPPGRSRYMSHWLR